MNTRSKLTIPVLFFSLLIFSQNNTKVENLKSFAKIYGLVKYFHPSDEAAKINWNKFAVYGASKIVQCQSERELIDKLKELFEPIAPGINFTNSSQSEYNISLFKPNNINGYNLTYWQHLGVGLNMNNKKNSPYKSVRVNALIQNDVPNYFGKLIYSVKVGNLIGKELRYRAWAKLVDTSKSTARIRMAFVNLDGTTTIKSEKVNEQNWKSYEVYSKVDSTVTKIEIGAAFKGGGSLLIDNVELSYWDKTSWKEIPIENAGFENENITNFLEKDNWFKYGNGYKSEVIEGDKFKGKKCGLICQVDQIPVKFEKKIFDFEPKFSDFIQESIGDSIFCRVPIALYSDKSGTFPKINKNKFFRFNSELKKASENATDLEVRLGNLIITYNIFQHFYPYMNYTDVNWEKQLEDALFQSFIDKSEKDHYKTLETLTASLKDGHIKVKYLRNSALYTPKIKWEWIEGKLMISSVLDDSLPIKVGDVVTHINNEKSEDYFSKIYSRISAATDGWLRFRGDRKSLLGDYNEKIKIRIKGKEIILNRIVAGSNPKKNNLPYKRLNDHTYYINFTRIESDTLKRLLPQLVNTKAIICDLRGYPNQNHFFINHLLKENDTSSSWMKIPKIVYPNRNKLVGYKKQGWLLQKREPYLGDKNIVFLTDGRAISYSESFLSFIKGYNLATIIGQPTAGTNGNINTLNLEGGFKITWTGMMVLNHDGSRHYGIGIIPDIYVKKTIEGIKSGKDEVLLRALALIKLQN